MLLMYDVPRQCKEPDVGRQQLRDGGGVQQPQRRHHRRLAPLGVCEPAEDGRAADPAAEKRRVDRAAHPRALAGEPELAADVGAAAVRGRVVLVVRRVEEVAARASQRA